ncbi:MAG: ATP-binding protein [Bryobacteraceae bacterium]
MVTDVQPGGTLPPDQEALPMAGVEAAGQDSADDFDQLKGQFLASLNHELRTPLSGVLGMADLLAETNLDTEQRDYVDTLRECAGQLLGTLNSVLEYSAWSAGNFRLEESEFAIARVLQDLASQTRLQAKLKGLAVMPEWDQDLPETVFGDEKRLHQLLSNLLSNAVKFTSRGHIDFRVRRPGPVDRHYDSGPGREWFVFEVQDTGIGIAPHKLNLIFESFRQLDSGLARRYTGLGIGLSLAQKIVDAMGGDLSVSSEVGRGSIFSARIPLGVGPAIAETDMAVPRPTRQARVLVVDDNRIAQQVVGHLLEKADYEVMFADDGEAGVRAAGRGHFDAILMDLQMPGMDGLSAARRIRQLPGKHKIPIFAFTANYSDEQRLACQRAGMQGFLTKPIDREHLLASLEQAIARS